MNAESPPLRKRSAALGWTALGFAVLLGLHYTLARLPAGYGLWLGLARRGRDLAVLTALIAGAWGVGAAALRRLAPRVSPGAYHAALAVGLGFLYSMTAVMLLAVAQGIRPWTLAVVLVLPLALVWHERHTWAATWRILAARQWRVTPVGIVLVLAAALYLALSLAPPSWTDALTYHLTIPKEYLEHGGVPADHGNFFHNFPVAFSMPYLLLMGLGSDLLPQLLHLFFLLLTAVVAGHHFRRAASPWVASYAVLLFVCQWTNYHGAQRANVDFQFAFYALAALLLLAESLADDTAPFARTWPVVCGLFAGAALAGRMQGVTCFSAIGLVLLVQLARRRVGWSQAAAFAGAAGAVYAPTLLRNAVYSFDPFLFMIGDRFGWTQGAAPLALERFRDLGDMKALFMTRPGIWTFLLAPVFVYTDGAYPTTTFDGFLDPLYLLGLPLAVLLLRHDRGVRLVLLALAGFYVGWFFTTPLTRYAIAVLPLLAFLTLASFERLSRLAGASGGLLRRGFAALVLALCSFNLLHFAAESPYLVAYGTPAFFDLLPRRAFLERTGAIHGLAAGEAIARLEARAGRTTRDERRAVFMILASESYYLPARYFNDPFYVNLGLLERRRAEGRDPLDWLRERGYGYVLFEHGRMGWLLGRTHRNPLLNPYADGLAKLQQRLDFFRREIEPRLEASERLGPLMLYTVPDAAPPNSAGQAASRSE